MRCPKHPAVWLYENMIETAGYCPECGEWYPLDDKSGNDEVEKKSTTETVKNSLIKESG